MTLAELREEKAKLEERLGEVDWAIKAAEILEWLAKYEGQDEETLLAKYPREEVALVLMLRVMAKKLEAE